MDVGQAAVLAMDLRPKLISRIRVRCGDVTLCEEVVDEAIYRVILRKDAIRGNNLWPWLLSISYNLIYDRMKHVRVAARHAPILFNGTHSTSPAREASEKDLEAVVQSALELLPQMQREAFKLCKLDGLSCREAGVRLNVREQYVRSLVHRARQKLKAHFRDFAA